ncbi:hypothetical protein RJ641_002769 [Dillenia turbinata]|uniref:Poor homologous synapsis 1 PH domain-containing protein n=1 Tax=Dillenia turbinata TaxID=194707 RepID=A0AAN8ZAG3_9MAGN
MEGDLVLVEREQIQKPLVAINKHWEVHIARFFSFPSLSSTHPYLRVQSEKSRRGRTGVWISSSSTASLRLSSDHRTSDAILSVILQGKILEVLEEQDVGLPCDLASDISCHSEFIPSTAPQNRSGEESSLMISGDSYAPQMPLSLKEKVEQPSTSHDISLNHNFGGSVSSTFPPSFTELLSNCNFKVQQADAPRRTSMEDDLKSQIAQYMGDSAFQEMLSTVEKVVRELEGDLML